MACNSWSETCAAYRFLGNADVEWRDMMEPHWEQTQKRMSAHPVVLCLQDTTELDFNGQEATGLGPLNYEARRGGERQLSWPVDDNYLGRFVT